MAGQARVLARLSRCCGEAYFKYVEGGNPRRTPLIGKIAIYGWKLNKSRKIPSALDILSLLA